jgi:hypothetical protein
MTCRSFNSLAVRLVALIFLSTGCTDATQSAGPTAPPPASPPASSPASSPAVAPPPPFPALSRPGEIFRAPDALYDSYSGYHGSQLGSRYVLYDSATFGLQFSSLRFGFFEYAGHYSTSADAVLTFTFDGNPSWQATGILRGDSLIISYNVSAMMSDFMDGVYVRSPGQ